MYQDRLGTNRAYGQFYPFGEGITATTGTNTVMFAGYLRDSYTGVDYANQRFYASTYGRFLTADRVTSSNAKVIPANWNKYAYVSGDPINKRDPRGTCSPDDDPPCFSATGTASSGDTWSWGDPLDDAFWASLSGPDPAADPAAVAECLPACANAQIGQPGTGVYQQMIVTAQAALLSAAYSEALTLLNNPNCAGLFNLTGAQSPANLLSSLYSMNGTQGQITWGQTGDANATTIAEVNQETGGSFVDIILNNNLFGPLAMGTAYTGMLGVAQTLLHELGHAYMFLYGPNSTQIVGNDNPTAYPNGSLQQQQAQQNQNNNQNLVRTNCQN